MALSSSTSPNMMAATHPIPASRQGGLPILAATLTEVRIGTAIACFYIVAIILLVGALVPAIKQIDLGALLTSSAGKALLGTAVNSQALHTFTGYLSVEFYGTWFCLFFGGFLAFISGGIVARPIEDGTIELSLARPFSRTRFYLERCAAMLVVGLILSLVALAAVWLDTRMFTGTQVDWSWMLLTQLSGGTFLILSVGLGAVIGAFSSIARTAGSAAIGILILGYIFGSLAELSDRLAWLDKLSPFHYAPLSAILVQHQITWWYLPFLTALGIVGIVVGLIVFVRRDLPT